MTGHTSRSVLSNLTLETYLLKHIWTAIADQQSHSKADTMIAPVVNPVNEAQLFERSGIHGKAYRLSFYDE
jgi:hypothetical protein